MTLQQLKYVITVAETGTITEAANQLFISQPSLTNAIHELEKEMNIVIFNRTNKGISLSKEGEGFLGYARQVLEQAAILEDKYKRNGGGKKQFCVSTQHYSFAVNAFVDLIKEYGQEEYVKYGSYEPLTVTITHILNNKSGINFGSYAHTGLPVEVLVKGVGAETFDGYYDNTDIYNRMAELTGVE